MLQETALVTMSAGARKRPNSPDRTSVNLNGLSLLERLEMVTSAPLEEHSSNDLVSSFQNLVKNGHMTSDRDQCLRDGVLEVTLQVHSRNAVKLRFLSSGTPDSFSDNLDVSSGFLGFCEDLRLSLVDHGCEADRISDAWLCNHKRWIVWKLAATERRFSTVFGGLLLTYKNLVTKLCQRYNQEIRDGKRSAIRKILNKDLSPSFMMILCVCQIFCYNDEKYKPTKEKENSAVREDPSRRHEEYSMELSDDWYSIHAVADDRVAESIREGKIRVGTKIMISNGSLVGADDGVDPLDSSYAPDQRNCTTFLRFSSNASRLAKWDAKLGLVSPSRQLQCEEGLFRVRKVSDIVPGGGFISLIYLTVCRIYPRMYLHRKASGDEWISESEDRKESLAFEKRKQKMVYAFSDEVEEEAIKVSLSK